MATTSEVKQASRIIYVDPNNAAGGTDNNGTPNTPEYTDFCIAFDLICEKTSRKALKNASVGKNDVAYAVFSWNSNVHVDANGKKASNWFSFLQGTKVSSSADDGTRFLSTYYTDVSFNEIRKKAQIEGLGVQSVTISYESWYTPTIKIRFVDVRGSAIFDREEVIHDNDTDTVTEDNLFGCFLTIPYPKFKLQVKGFYGRAVTYQLACTDYRGSYEATTGNFIADVTFVGYDYGMLNDIPMIYLYAAPFCGYYGNAYWNQHKSSPEWRLSDGSQPITLYDLKNKIGNAMKVSTPNTDNSDSTNYSTTDGTSNDNAGNSSNVDSSASTFSTSSAGGGGKVTLKGEKLVEFTKLQTRKTALTNIQNKLNETLDKLKKGFNVWCSEDVGQGGDKYTYYYFASVRTGQEPDFLNSMNIRKFQNAVNVDGKKRSGASRTALDLDQLHAAELGYTILRNLVIKYNDTYSDIFKQEGLKEVYHNRFPYGKLLRKDQVTVNRWTQYGNRLSELNLNGPTQTIWPKWIFDGMLNEHPVVFQNDDSRVTALGALKELYNTQNPGAEYFVFNDNGWGYRVADELKRVNKRLRVLDPSYGISSSSASNFSTAGYAGTTASSSATSRSGSSSGSSYSTSSGNAGGGKDRAIEISNMVGITPYIGNIFKIIMCHMETFLYMMDRCAENIEGQIPNGQRKRSSLGISNVGETDMQFLGVDINNDPDILAFPAVTGLHRNLSTDESEKIDSNIRYETWPGDFGFRNTISWEEERLVLHLLLALRKMEDNIADVGNGTLTPIAFPVIPSDLRHDKLPSMALSSLDSLCGWLGLRIAAIFGVSYPGCTVSDARVVGRMDAYNLCMGLGSPLMLNSFLKSLGKADGATVSYGIMTCDSEFDSYGTASVGMGDTRHAHEVTDNNAEDTDRHKIFDTNGKYTYTVTRDGNALVPIFIDNFSAVRGDEDSLNNVLVGKGNPIEVKPKLEDNEGNRYLYRVQENNVISTDKGFSEKQQALYTNSDMFDIVLDTPSGSERCRKDVILDIYKSLAEEDITIFDYTDKSHNIKKAVLDKLWKVGKFEKDRYFKNQNGLFYDPIAVGGEADWIKPDEKSKEGKTTVIPSQSTAYVDGDREWATRIKNIQARQTLAYSDSGWDRGNAYNPSIYVIKNNEFHKQSLFGSEIYYAQNQERDSANLYGKRFTGETLASYAKALLFLSTLPYNLTEGVSFAKSSNGSVSVLPYGYVLMIGAYLFRRELYRVTGRELMLFPQSTKPSKEHIPDADTTFFCKGKNNIFAFNADNSNDDYIPLSTIIPNPESSKKNVFIAKFEEFALDKWKEIMTHCEIKAKDGKLMDDSEFGVFVDILLKEYNTNKDTEVGSAYDVRDISNNCRGIIGNYMATYFQCSIGLRSIDLLLSNENPVLNDIRTIYTTRAVVLNSKPVSNPNGNMVISPDIMKSYLKGFWDAIADIANATNNLAVEEVSADRSGELNEKDRDFCIATYMHLKTIWDKWILGMRNDWDREHRTIVCSDGTTIVAKFKWYSIQSYFSNFVFIDTFYRNIFDVLHVNCEILYELLSDLNDKNMVFNFLSHICKRHHCMFIGLPDYIAMGDANESIAQENLSTMFKPIPYSQMNRLEMSNKFIVMFVHPPAKVNSDNTEYAQDNFDIWLAEENKIHPRAERMFSKTKSGNVEEANVKIYNMQDRMDAQMTRYGYYIPSFGITMNRLNNSIFQNVTANMNNPVVTEQSIFSFANILERQRGNDKAVVFYGQDLFPTYTGYSYTIEVTMAGDAQIMPLMYCQLTNMPMFRGTYMIFSVTHTMGPGDMKTTFKAMRMSRNALPYAQGWFTEPKKAYYIDKYGHVIYDDECPNSVRDDRDRDEEAQSTNGALSWVWSELYESSQKIQDDGTVVKNDKPNSEAQTNLTALCEHVLNQMSDRLGYKPNVTSGYRCVAYNAAIRGANGSQHTTGQAVDLQFSAVNRAKNLEIAQAITANGVYDQLILEDCDNKDGSDPKWIHVSYTTDTNNPNRKEILVKWVGRNSYITLTPEQCKKMGLVPDPC